MISISASVSVNSNEGYNYNERIEFSLLDTQLKLDQLNVKRFQVQYYPSLYANFNYGVNAGANEFSGMDQWFSFGAYGLQLSIPIFDGFRKSAQIQQAKLTMKKTEVDKVDLMRTIDIETSQKTLNITSQHCGRTNQSILTRDYSTNDRMLR